jgi:hypothetical protein
MHNNWKIDIYPFPDCKARARKMRRWAQQASVKNWFSNAIKVLKPDRTLSDVRFKNKQPKPKLCSPIDDENKKFLQFIKNEEKKVVTI